MNPKSSWARCCGVSFLQQEVQDSPEVSESLQEVPLPVISS